MNYCTKCQSFYQTPGTCNCFAGALPTTQPVPSVPYPYIPWYPTGPNTTPWVPVYGGLHFT